MPTGPDSKVPLLSIPPNVTFSRGLTVDKVLEGPSTWPGQAYQLGLNADEAVAGGDGAPGEREGGLQIEEPPPPPRVGRAPTGIPTPSGRQRMQVGSSMGNYSEAGVPH